MRRTRFQDMECPIARTLDRVGEWWSILLLRDAFAGVSRFDDFQTSLGIAPNMLARRLQALVEAGLLRKVRYNLRPARYEYALTERGRDFRPVLLALLAYGNRHFAPEGVSVMVVDAVTGEPAEPTLVDKRTGRVLREPDYAVVAGPAASEAGKARLLARTARLTASRGDAG